jgi:hypothetical protein
MNPTGCMQGESLLNGQNWFVFGCFVTISIFNILNDWVATTSSNI